ncbi:MAG: FecR family protein [Candidatus Omnitrophica bacterium]|nr:FecR family protein [Candidatus Omnitrophota bacterium]MDD5488696.1 FecR family protein [Candidatus Omnitrophota bacterium]
MKKTIISIMTVCLIVCGAMCAWAMADKVVVVSYAGDVKIMPAGQNAAVACSPGMFLSADYGIVTGKESYVEIAFDRAKNNTIRVGEKSDVVIKLSSSDKIELVEGELIALLRNLKKGEAFRVRTPNAVCGARGTDFGMDVHDDTTSVQVFESTVFVRGVKQDGSVMEDEKWVEQGYKLAVKRFEKPGTKVKMTADEMNKLKEKARSSNNGRPGNKFDKMGRLGEARSNLTENRMDSVQEKRDNKRIDDIKDNRPSSNVETPRLEVGE